METLSYRKVDVANNSVNRNILFRKCEIEVYFFPHRGLYINSKLCWGQRVRVRKEVGEGSVAAAYSEELAGLRRSHCRISH